MLPAHRTDGAVAPGRGIPNYLMQKTRDRLVHEFKKLIRADRYAVALKVMKKPKWKLDGIELPENSPRFVVFIDVYETSITPPADADGHIFLYARGGATGQDYTYVRVCTVREFLTEPTVDNLGENRTTGASKQFLAPSVVKDFLTAADADAFALQTLAGIQKFLNDYAAFAEKQAAALSWQSIEHDIVGRKAKLVVR